MPLYEYQCKKCGVVVEVMQRMSDPAPKLCDSLGEDKPDCEGGGELQKLLSRSAFVLKGEGWYVTDYARKDKKGGKGGSGSEKGSGGDSGTSSGSDGGGKSSKGPSDSKSGSTSSSSGEAA